MRRPQLLPALVVALALFAVLAVAQPAEACYGYCEKVGQFCRVCVQWPTYTGVNCEQLTACACIFRDTCQFFAAEKPRSEPAFLAPEPILTPIAPQPRPERPAADGFDLAAALAAA